MSTTTMDDEESGPVIGSGDFLADRGYNETGSLRLRILMANEIALIAEARGLTQKDVASQTGLSQSDVSRIVNRLVRDFSTDRLMRALTSLGKDVHIAWSDAKHHEGSIVVDASDNPEEERAYAL
jgi:predicted XRE-type DNA-binding protein